MKRPGELWVFDSKVRQWADNPSDEPRVHLIFDVLPARYPGFFVPGRKGTDKAEKHRGLSCAPPAEAPSHEKHVQAEDAAAPTEVFMTGAAERELEHMRGNETRRALERNHAATPAGRVMSAREHRGGCRRAHGRRGVPTLWAFHWTTLAVLGPAALGEAVTDGVDDGALVICLVDTGIVTTDVLRWVLPLRVNGRAATGFTIDLGHRQYVLTTRAAQGRSRPTHIDVEYDEWVTVPVEIVGTGRGDDDVAALAAGRSLSANAQAVARRVAVNVVHRPRRHRALPGGPPPVGSRECRVHRHRRETTHTRAPRECRGAGRGHAAPARTRPMEGTMIDVTKPRHRYRAELEQAFPRAGGNSRKRTLRAMVRAATEYRGTVLDAADADVLVWSDLHLGHANIIDCQDRPFFDAADMKRGSSGGDGSVC